MSNCEVMVAYYEAHPDEIPQQTVIPLSVRDEKQEFMDEPKLKRGLSKNDLALALGVSFGLTFIVIAVLYVSGVLS